MSYHSTPPSSHSYVLSPTMLSAPSPTLHYAPPPATRSTPPPPPHYTSPAAHYTLAPRRHHHVPPRPPNCSVCDSPAKHQCSCEFTSLIVAVEDSEQKVLGGVWDEIRRWVTMRAQASIHASFRALSAQHGFDERMVDEDWRACVARYPQVLEHYYREMEGALRCGVEGVIGGSGGGGGY